MSNDTLDGQRMGLSPISLADQSTFRLAFSSLGSPTSDYSFANTFCWSTSMKLYQLQTDRHLCVFANGGSDLTLLIPPMPLPGATPADLRDAIANCFEVMDTYNALHTQREASRIEYVSDEAIEIIQSVPGYQALHLSTTPMGADYIYDTQKMVTLDGGDLRSKRKAKNQFERLYPDHACEDLRDEHVEACVTLLSLWQRHGDETHLGEVTEQTHVGTDILRQKDTLACETALRCRHELGLQGMIVTAAGQIVGFTLGEALTNRQSSILFEKTHPEFRGCAQYIFSEFCKRYWAHLPECNVGDDWGIPGLRQAKQTYRPIRLLNKSLISHAPSLIVQGFAPMDLPENRQPVTLGSSFNASSTVAAAVSLRDAIPADLDALVNLENNGFSDDDERFSRRQMRRLIANPRAVVRVAESDGRVVAWACGLIRQHRKSFSGRLYALAVHAEMRGRGIGASLSRDVIDTLSQRRVAWVYLEVRQDNDAAIKLYQSMGFQLVRALPNYYSPGRHAWRMRRKVVEADATADAGMTLWSL